MMHMRVVQVASSAQVSRMAVNVAILAGVVALFGTALALLLAAPAHEETGSVVLVVPPAAIASTPATHAQPGYQFSDHPMLTDVNGDGIVDVVGKSRIPAGDAWIAAYDGRDGKVLWKTAPLSKDATPYDARRAVLLDRVISVDALGKVQAYDLRTGTPSWAAVLTDKAARICQGDGVVVVETVDEQRTAFDPATGARRSIAEKAPCAAVPTSDADEAPTYRIVGWPSFGALGLPPLHALDGLAAHRALVPNGPGPRFMLGERDKGTRVAMVAAVDGKRVLWKELVPGVDPLTTDVNVTTQAAAFAGDRLVVPTT
jgi:hypothetical protein